MRFCIEIDAGLIQQSEFSVTAATIDKDGDFCEFECSQCRAFADAGTKLYDDDFSADQGCVHTSLLHVIIAMCERDTQVQVFAHSRGKSFQH